MNDKNKMLLNNIDIGISRIEVDKWDLIVISASKKYLFQVKLEYNWKDLNQLKSGEEQTINFHEYCLAENNENALIWPEKSVVKRLNQDEYAFSFIFTDMSNTRYMNMRNCFDIKLESLEIEVVINLKEVN